MAKLMGQVGKLRSEFYINAQPFFFVDFGTYQLGNCLKNAYVYIIKQSYCDNIYKRNK